MSYSLGAFSPGEFCPFLDKENRPHTSYTKAVFVGEECQLLYLAIDNVGCTAERQT